MEYFKCIFKSRCEIGHIFAFYCFDGIFHFFYIVDIGTNLRHAAESVHSKAKSRIKIKKKIPSINYIKCYGAHIECECDDAMTTGNYHFVLKTWHRRTSCIGKCNQIDEIVIAECVKYGIHCFYGQFKRFARH